MKKTETLFTVMSIVIAVIFVQSLFFKFTDAPETQHIFGTLDAWAGGLGAPGLFAKGGIFSAYVIGSAELLTSIIILVGTFSPKLRVLQGVGGLMATGVMTGAIFFHLFTPLGIEVEGDGGQLFAMACGIWVSGLVIAAARRNLIRARLSGQRGAQPQG